MGGLQKPLYFAGMKASLHPSFKINGQPYSGGLLESAAQDGAASAAFVEEWLGPEPFIRVTTSGSTGAPKAIRLSKAAMHESAKATGTFLNVGEGARALLCLPVKYIAGKMMMVRAMVLGWDIYPAPPTSRPLQGLQVRFEVGAMTPMQLYNSLDSPTLPIDKIMVGGAAVSSELKAKLQGLSTDIYETYGMTETVSHIAMRKLSPVGEPYFRCLPGISVCLDPRGCLVISAPRIAPESIVTNDLAHCIGTACFEWLGRYDNVVNSGGLKLIPEQIERALEGKILNPFFVAGKPDPILGEKLVLIVEGQAENFTEAHRMAISGLPKHERPKDIFFVGAFARTPTGKIDRQSTLKKPGEPVP